MNRIALFMTTVFALLPLGPASAQEAYRPPVSIHYSIDTVIVHADRTHERIMESAYRVETDLGVAEHGERIISFNSTLEELEILKAETVSPDGQRWPLDSNAIRTVEDEITGGAPMFSDIKHKVMVYPNVQVGSLLYLKARSRQHTPHFGNQFFLHDSFSPHERYGHAQYHVIVHPSVALQISSEGMQGGEITPNAEQEAKGPAGYRHYVLNYQQDFAHSPEAGQIPYVYFGPHIMLSTFRDYLEVGESYGRYATPKARVTPEIQALAQEITQGVTDPKDQARALYEWVTRNIRYVAIYLGDGGFEPHDVEAILRNRYGDCKDHVVLLQALLKARGIESSPALINAGAGEALSPVAVTFPFNHVILYLPEQDLYLDPTAQFAPFGVLPESLLNKPVVLTSMNRLARTPKMRAKEHRTVSQVRLVMLEDGSLRGTSTTSFTGAPEFEARGRHFDREGRSPERTVRRLLGRFKEVGSGVIEDSDPSNIAKPFELRSRFELDAPVNIPGPSAMTVPVGLSPGIITSTAYMKPLKQRRFPVNCSSEEFVEHVELRFPKSIRVTRIPSNTVYQDATISYSSSYQLTQTASGQVLTVKRQLSTQYESGTCKEPEEKAWQTFHAVLHRDIRSQIFLE
jgi:hypothetical protein